MISLVRASTAAALMVACGVVGSQAQSPKLDMDFASFAYDDDHSLLEMYLAIGSSSLAYRADSTGLVADLPIYLGLGHATVSTMLEGPPEPVWSDSVHFQFALPDSTSFGEGQHFVHQVRAAVPPGEYELSITIPPGANGQGQVIKRDVLVPDFSDQTQSMVSDIELATSIGRAQSRDDEFYKNGLSVRPNPHILYGSDLPRLYYYFETYNVGMAESGQYTVYAFVSRSSVPQPVGDLSSRVTRDVRSPDAIVGSFRGRHTAERVLHP